MNTVAVTQDSLIVQILVWGIALWPWILIPCWFIRRYALQKIGLRSGVAHDWLVWVPGLSLYVQGGISDQYCRRVKPRKKYKRILLPLFQIAKLLLWIPAVKMIAEGYAQYEEIVSIGASEIAASLMLSYAVLDALVYLIPALILGIVGLVMRYVALHDVYTICNPEHCSLYLVMSLIPCVNIITQPLFLFLCRNRDGGMLPGRDTVREPSEL